MTNKEILEKSFNDLSPLSSGWKKEFSEHLATFNLIKNFSGDVSGKRVLDIGCGLGIFVYALSLAGAKAEGVDMNILKEWGISGIEEMWDKRNIKVKVGDFFNEEYADSSFDIVVAENVFEHLPYRQREFLEKIRKILAPGGLLILATPNLTSFLKRARMLAGRSPYWDLDDFFKNGQPFGHFREFTGEELKRMANWSGFEVLAVKKYNTYFKRRWIFGVKKLPSLLAWILSGFLPTGRDTLFLVARK